MQKGFWGPVSLGDAHGLLPSRRALLVADDSSVIRGWTRHPPVWIIGSGVLPELGGGWATLPCVETRVQGPTAGRPRVLPEVSSLSRLCSHSHPLPAFSPPIIPRVKRNSWVNWRPARCPWYQLGSVPPPGSASYLSGAPRRTNHLWFGAMGCEHGCFLGRQVAREERGSC